MTVVVIFKVLNPPTLLTPWMLLDVATGRAESLISPFANLKPGLVTPLLPETLAQTTLFKVTGPAVLMILQTARWFALA